MGDNYSETWQEDTKQRKGQTRSLKKIQQANVDRSAAIPEEPAIPSENPRTKGDGKKQHKEPKEHKEYKENKERKDHQLKPTESGKKKGGFFSNIMSSRKGDREEPASPAMQASPESSSPKQPLKQKKHEWELSEPIRIQDVPSVLMWNYAAPIPSALAFAELMFLEACHRLKVCMVDTEAHKDWESYTDKTLMEEFQYVLYGDFSRVATQGFSRQSQGNSAPTPKPAEFFLACIRIFLNNLAENPFTTHIKMADVIVSCETPQKAGHTISKLPEPFYSICLWAVDFLLLFYASRDEELTQQVAQKLIVLFRLQPKSLQEGQHLTEKETHALHRFIFQVVAWREGHEVMRDQVYLQHSLTHVRSPKLMPRNLVIPPSSFGGILQNLRSDAIVSPVTSPRGTEDKEFNLFGLRAPSIMDESVRDLHIEEGVSMHEDDKSKDASAASATVEAGAVVKNDEPKEEPEEDAGDDKILALHRAMRAAWSDYQELTPNIRLPVEVSRDRSEVSTAMRPHHYDPSKLEWDIRETMMLPSPIVTSSSTSSPRIAATPSSK